MEENFFGALVARICGVRSCASFLESTWGMFSEQTHVGCTLFEGGAGTREYALRLGVVSASIDHVVCDDKFAGTRG